MTKKISKSEFTARYCKNSEISEKKLLETNIILPCKCGKEGCKGWAVVINGRTEIKAHNDINR